MRRQQGHLAARVAAAAGLLLGAAAAAAPNLPEEEFERKLRAAAPTEAEALWRSIAWHPNLASGLREAVESDRPVLLWLMNGNPAGFC